MDFLLLSLALIGLHRPSSDATGRGRPGAGPRTSRRRSRCAIAGRRSGITSGTGASRAPDTGDAVPARDSAIQNAYGRSSLTESGMVFHPGLAIVWSVDDTIDGQDEGRLPDVVRRYDVPGIRCNSASRSSSPRAGSRGASGDRSRRGRGASRRGEDDSEGRELHTFILTYT